MVLNDGDSINGDENNHGINDGDLDDECNSGSDV